MELHASNMEDLKNSLLKEGVNPSFQRLKIYEYLMKTRAHPTVEKIYTDLSPEIPTLSKTTIYNTLNLFQEKNIVAGLTIEGKEVRYDGNVEPHAHFKCSTCGELLDLSIDPPTLASDMVGGHRVTEMHFYLKGVCKDCLESKR